MTNKKESRTIFIIFSLGLLLSVILFAGCPAGRDESVNTNADVAKDDVNQSSTIAEDEDAGNVTNEMIDNTKTDDITSIEKTPVEVKGNFTHMDPKYATVLKEWLKDNSSWEPALRKDAEAVNPGEKNHPFYIAGDFNKDGKEDFMVGLAKTKNRKKHAFIIFNAPFTSKKPAFFTDRTESYDIIGYDGEFGIFVGPAQSDNGYSLIAKGDEYKAVSPFDEESP